MFGEDCKAVEASGGLAATVQAHGAPVRFCLVVREEIEKVVGLLVVSGCVPVLWLLNDEKDMV